ncbi:glycosyltransferase family 4 protein [Winogradskyella sp. PG-2]|uniref:glycosyltransferase family 4 protein n=1 Tax=Winogradskyella sp. PG-2 TaxID=754409 RepID=UPI00045867F8|nr:glycosyltransferase family 4 protein [Winogradskyella sp. PG-2]BAO74403.1 exopolysaccharide biosynthesis glycosyltransferase EpsF [Winogradskyella sp. PG-2]
MKTNILITSIGLPSTKIGSWNIMFSKLIEAKPSLFTHIICPKSNNNQSDSKYYIVNPPLIKSYKFQKIVKHYRYRNYYKVLKKILNREDFVTINIIDNINMLLSIHQLLEKDNLRHKVVLIYHLHGYELSIENKSLFYKSADKLLVLTNTTYSNQIKVKRDSPCKIKQIYNGIDTELFYPISKYEQAEIRRELNFEEDKTYYLWVSQDRKKKGLQVVLEAWETFIKDKPNVRLLVIGTDKYKYKKAQVVFVGRKLNNQLPKYYQIATFFLFSTLCHEGHPLALTEALVSGCYCLASKIDPIPEVLNNGEYGVLVANPNNPKSWIIALDATFKSYKIEGHKFTIPNRKYSLLNWFNNMENLIQEEHNINAVE